MYDIRLTADELKSIANTALALLFEAEVLDFSEETSAADVKRWEGSKIENALTRNFPHLNLREMVEGKASPLPSGSELKRKAAIFFSGPAPASEKPTITKHEDIAVAYQFGVCFRCGMDFSNDKGISQAGSFCGACMSELTNTYQEKAFAEMDRQGLWELRADRKTTSYKQMRVVCFPPGEQYDPARDTHDELNVHLGWFEAHHASRIINLYRNAGSGADYTFTNARLREAVDTLKK